MGYSAEPPSVSCRMTANGAYLTKDRCRQLSLEPTRPEVGHFEWNEVDEAASATAAGSVFFFRGTHNVRDDLQLSHFMG